MQNFFRQNRNILVVALSIFIVSMTALLFFLNSTERDSGALQTNILQHESGEPVDVDLEKSYQDLFQCGDEPFVVMKLDGHITFANSKFLASTGFVNDDLRGKLFFSLIDSRDLTAFFSAFGKVVETGKAVTMVGPFRLADKAGDYKTSMGSVIPVIEKGKVARVGIVIKDISNAVKDNQDNQDNQLDAPEKGGIVPITEPTVKKATVKKPPNFKNASKEPDGQNNNEPDSTQTRWEKPNSLRDNDPSWIMGGKLVMLFPFNLPLFPAHLLLAQM